MADCSNVEIRELLPERAGSALSVADTARVDAHLSSCKLCTSELALIERARRVLRYSPTIDVSRIAVSVIAATSAPSRPQLVASGARASTVRRRPALRWVGWKAAAAIAIAAAGVGSFAVWNTANESPAAPNVGAVEAARALPNAPDSQASSVQPGAVLAASAPSGPAELGVAGGLTELSDGDLQALLGELGASNSAAIADASFEEPELLVPSVGVTADEESI